MKAAVIVACGGQGRRLGGTVQKQYLSLAGKTVLEHTLDVFEAHPLVGPIVVVLPAAGRPQAVLEAIVKRYAKVAEIVAGGDQRQASVSRGLAALLALAETEAGAAVSPSAFGGGPAAEAAAGLISGLPWRGPVLVQDGVRPCTPAAVIDRVIQGTLKWGACVPAIRVRDTLKEADEAGRVTKTMDRRGLWQIQTPQGFDGELLWQAYRLAREQGLTATDDAGLVEALGHPVHLVEGSPVNMKLTYGEDLPLFEALLGGKQA